MTPPAQTHERPIAIVGAGTLGRRIALMFAAGGSEVQLFNRSAENAGAAKRPPPPDHRNAERATRHAQASRHRPGYGREPC